MDVPIERGFGRQLLESPRILGVGLGVFFLALFLIISVLGCVLGSRTRKPGVVYAALTVMYGVVVTVILATPRADGKPVVMPEAGYNHTIIPTMVMTILMGIGVLASAAGMFIFHVTSTTYTRPLNYHTDVLLQR